MPTRPVFERDHIIALDKAAEQQVCDVVEVSPVAYPLLAESNFVGSVQNLGKSDE